MREGGREGGGEREGERDIPPCLHLSLPPSYPAMSLPSSQMNQLMHFLPNVSMHAFPAQCVTQMLHYRLYDQYVK